MIDEETAIHEAGHAVVFFLKNFRLQGIQCVEGEWETFVEPEEPRNKKWAERRAVCVLAGPIVEIIFFGERRRGSAGQDVGSFYDLLDYMELKELKIVPGDPEHNRRLYRNKEEEINRLKEKFEDEAWRLLSKQRNRQVVKILAEVLMKKGPIGGKEVTRIIEENLENRGESFEKQ